MSYVLKLRGVIVGRSELERADPGMGIRAGVFRPGLGYELVQPIFRLFAEATPMPGGEPLDQIKLARYLDARDKLPLELVDARGRTIKTAAIHIADYSEKRGPDAMSLDVLIPEDEYWEER